nr:helix-turn-helix transcriptional regulator [Bradyrhizobium manausense]
MLSPAQARAARAWLDWSKEELAERSGVSEKSIARFERGQSMAYASTLIKLRAAFESAGICFDFEGAAAKGIRVYQANRVGWRQRKA